MAHAFFTLLGVSGERKGERKEYQGGVKKRDLRAFAQATEVGGLVPKLDILEEKLTDLEC